jgi:hypothetical protein
MRLEYHPAVRQDVAEAMWRYKAVFFNSFNPFNFWDRFHISNFKF